MVGQVAIEIENAKRRHGLLAQAALGPHGLHQPFGRQFRCGSQRMREEREPLTHFDIGDATHTPLLSVQLNRGVPLTLCTMMSAGIRPWLSARMKISTS